MDELLALLGRRIRQEREARGIKQYELADAIPTDRGYLSKVEAGRTPPSLATIKAIADMLNIKIAVLFEDIPAKSAPKFDGWALKVGNVVKDVEPKKRSSFYKAIKLLAKK